MIEHEPSRWDRWVRENQVILGYEEFGSKALQASDVVFVPLPENIVNLSDVRESVTPIEAPTPHLFDWQAEGNDPEEVIAEQPVVDPRSQLINDLQEFPLAQA